MTTGVITSSPSGDEPVFPGRCAPGRGSLTTEFLWEDVFRQKGSSDKPLPAFTDFQEHTAQNSQCTEVVHFGVVRSELLVIFRGGIVCYPSKT